MLDLQPPSECPTITDRRALQPRAFTTMGNSLVLSSFSPPTGVAGCWASCDHLSEIPTSTGHTMAFTLDFPALWNHWQKSWASVPSTELLCKYQCLSDAWCQVWREGLYFSAATSGLELGHGCKKLCCLMAEGKTADLTAWVGPAPITHRPCNLRQIT